MMFCLFSRKGNSACYGFSLFILQVLSRRVQLFDRLGGSLAFWGRCE
jgi:hypothetical protein